jgi:recombination DNA repair RAD52 pathway protein
VSLTPAQNEQLLKGIHTSRVATRRGGGGKSLSYVEAYDIKAHMIRLFGFAEWSWDVLEASCAYTIAPDGTERNWKVGYRVIGRLTILATGATYTEAAVGMANLPDVGEAHDMAVKTAESDAFKRAAINLGDQFGLSLYNNGQTAPVVRGLIGAASNEASQAETEVSA